MSASAKTEGFDMVIGRREFIGRSAAAFGGFALSVNRTPAYSVRNSPLPPFRMKFAPRLTMDMFRSSTGKGLLERAQYFYDKGFRAVEGAVFFTHNVQTPQQIEEQAALGDLVRKLGMEMGCISSMNDKDHPIMTANFSPAKKMRDKSAVEDFLMWQMEGTFEIMRRLGCKTFIIGAGVNAPDLSAQEQYENVVRNMSFCARHCRKNGFVMEIEPLNEKTHKNIYVKNAALGARICADVDLPSCRLLYDLYHEHMQTGNNDALDDENVFRHILSFHMADAPSRKEPTSGVIDFEGILKRIWSRGFRGILGLEHGQTDNSKEGDVKLLEVYRRLDSLAT